MLRLIIDEILEERGKSKYWMFNSLDSISYQNFNKIYNRETISIKFETLEKIQSVFNCSFDELFIKISIIFD